MEMKMEYDLTLGVYGDIEGLGLLTFRKQGMKEWTLTVIPI